MAIQTTSLWGMIICHIDENNNLVSRWNNNMAPVNHQHFEIALKIAGSQNSLAGTYTVSWIEHQGNAVQGTLRITGGNNSSVTEWIWEIDGAPRFRGTGMQVGGSDVSVIYWDAGTLPVIS